MLLDGKMEGKGLQFYLLWKSLSIWLGTYNPEILDSFTEQNVLTTITSENAFNGSLTNGPMSINWAQRA